MTDRELLELLVSKVTGMEGEVSSLKEGQKSNRELLEITTAQVGGLTEKVNGLDKKVHTLTTDMIDVKSDLSNVKSEVKDIKKMVIKIEHEHGQKIEALFDGYKQNTEKLDRIEQEVMKHQELIIRRVK